MIAMICVNGIITIIIFITTNFVDKRRSLGKYSLVAD